ncbi:hypothetical protein [Metabacillus fastidiosus]|uniref:hypothetical protein n=1 Tax=Metabacillus fastidiosus TaxID=1458 RepID=UPI002DB68B6A|nr:hypothetical protein [Metabacillus fastidiosus]MEC2078686.1 hypothetical protein [Metabacillus fastidiosus]
MKKTYLFLLIINFLLIVSGCSSDYRYPPGKDTVDIFGNGKFQILSGTGDNNFMNVETQEDIELYVYKYKEIEPLVYVIGESGYTILNYQTEKVKKYKIIDNVPTKQQEIFVKMEKK